MGLRFERAELARVKHERLATETLTTKHFTDKEFVIANAKVIHFLTNEIRDRVGDERWFVG